VDVKTYGLEYPVGFEHGPGLASSTSTTTTLGNFDTITRQVSGLTPSTAVDYRPFAIVGVAAPRVRGATQQFTTDATSGPGPNGPAGPQGPGGQQGPAGPQGPPGQGRARHLQGEEAQAQGEYRLVVVTAGADGERHRSSRPFAIG
jgi:hypothetical protein